MKVIRFKHKNILHYGQVEGGSILPISSSVNEFFKSDFEPLRMDSVEVLPPIQPSKIICLAANFKNASGYFEDMTEPLVFVKSLNCLAISGEKIDLPFDLNCWGECELAVAIKKRCTKIQREEAKDYILGYLTANDLTYENLHDRDHHLARSKCLDKFCPISQIIETNFDVSGKDILGYQNGNLLRKCSLDDLVWGPEEAIFQLSQWMTLEPGDLILFGTPERVRSREFLKNGDRFIAKIEGLEPVENEFVSGPR